jgi:hypothetical protein
MIPTSRVETEMAIRSIPFQLRDIEYIKLIERSFTMFHGKRYKYGVPDGSEIIENLNRILQKTLFIKDWKDGLPNGSWIRTLKDGKVDLLINFRNGRLHGEQLIDGIKYYFNKDVPITKDEWSSIESNSKKEPIIDNELRSKQELIFTTVN